MSRRIHRSLVGVVALALVVLFTACNDRKSDAVGGIIKVTQDQSVHPIAQAQIKLTPLAPNDGSKSDEQPEDASNLRGVDTTNDTGAFQIATLSSDQTFQEYGLLRNWRYELQIQVPGYYIYKGEFPYESGTRSLEITLTEKGSDVEDDTGGVEIMEDGVQVGTVRRGI